MINDISSPNGSLLLNSTLKNTKRDIFTPRANYKPFEYPEILQFVNTINQTYWVHTELDYTSDQQDYFVSLSPLEKSAIQNSLLAISQIEVAVKQFWGKLYKYLPKPELLGLGSTFAECEFRHSEAYSRLLDVINANDAFANIMEVPQIKNRVNFLSTYLKKKVNKEDKRGYALSLVIFSLFIENTSLFSQFAIILSFTRFKSLLKNTSNVIAWTSKDEQIHAASGIFLFNTIIAENPELFDDEMKDTIITAAKKAIEVEEDILNWIFEKGELEFCSKESLLYFMKDRINSSLKSIGIRKVFIIPPEKLKPMFWFDEEIKATTHDDFFAKRPTEYSKFNKIINEDNLF